MQEHKEETTSGAQEWRAIFQQIGDQVRRDAARTVGAGEEADWKTIGQHTDEAARRTLAKTLKINEEAQWDEIGQAVERSARGGIAQVIGTSPNADWQTIGQVFEGKLDTFFKRIFSPASPAADQQANEEIDETDQVIDPWA